jgi:hypothetical protein
VEGQGHDEGDVVDPGLRGHVQHLLDDHLADVGRSMGGRGSEMSSKAMVSFMSGRNSAGRGDWSPRPDGFERASRMAAEGSFSGSTGSGA